MDIASRKAARDYASNPCQETAVAYWQAEERMGRCQLIAGANLYDRSVNLYSDNSRLLWRYRNDMGFGRRIMVAYAEARAMTKKRMAEIEKSKRDILAKHVGRDVKLNYEYWFWTGDKHESIIYSEFPGGIKEFSCRRMAAMEVYCNI